MISIAISASLLNPASWLVEAEERSDVRAGVNSENCKTYKFLHIFVTQDEQLDDYLKQAASMISISVSVQTLY